MDCYKCSECGTFYKDKALAAQCRAWCRKNPSCNPALRKFAVRKQTAPKRPSKGLDGCTYC